MSFNISGLLFGAAALGFTTYSYYKNRNDPLCKRVESAATTTQPTHSFRSPLLPATLRDRSFENIHNLREEKWQQKLKINLMYAHEAMQHTAKMLPFDAVNYGEDLKGISSELILKMDRMRQEIDEAIKQNTQPHHNFDNHHKIIADIAIKHKIGNCGEQVAVAYLYLKNEKNLRKVERLSLVNGDHGFIVIGRDPLSDITNPLTWGRAAVVCDPWGKKYFPAEQLFDQLNKLSQRVLYDPTLHSIGWSSFGDIPPEVTIYKGLKFHEQPNKKEFAKKCLANWRSGDTVPEKLIKACLIEYLEKKNNPKVAPKLSKTDLKKVESIWLQILNENDRIC